jgi:hypothetical protein
LIREWRAPYGEHEPGGDGAKTALGTDDDAFHATIRLAQALGSRETRPSVTRERHRMSEWGGR